MFETLPTSGGFSKPAAASHTVWESAQPEHLKLPNPRQTSVTKPPIGCRRIHAPLAACRTPRPPATPAWRNCAQTHPPPDPLPRAVRLQAAHLPVTMALVLRNGSVFRASVLMCSHELRSPDPLQYAAHSEELLVLRTRGSTCSSGRAALVMLGKQA